MLVPANNGLTERGDIAISRTLRSTSRNDAAFLRRTVRVRDRACAPALSRDAPGAVPKHPAAAWGAVDRGHLPDCRSERRSDRRRAVNPWAATNPTPCLQ